jgi:cell division protein FtsB
LVRSEKFKVEKHISLLKKNIDADMLDEKARKILYYAHPDEIIINTSKNQ